MKKLIVALLALTMVLSLCGCTSKEKEEEASTMGTALAAQFKKEIKNSDNITDIMFKLLENEVVDFKTNAYEFSGSCYMGFTEEIIAFDKGVCGQPVIGSIPFICYIFKATDAEGLKKTLLEKADPRWNICVEAEETVAEVFGDYVFFAMCPAAEEE